MSDQPDAHPPKNTRFKPGQSGNPKGRPKGRGHGPADPERFLNELVTAQTNGGTRRIPRRRALDERLFQLAMKGDVQATRTLLRGSAPHSKASINAALAEYKEQLARDGEQARAEVRRKLEAMAERSRKTKEMDQK